MKFSVLSHAGLLVESTRGRSVVFDPWLVGSCYWRSWWNYPPVPDELVRSLHPDFIFLTHIHWDHFHSVSLSRFGPDVPIVVPKGNYSRIRDDLFRLGHTNVRELRHGETMEVGRNFTITSYQFGVFLDSAALIECEGVKLLNLNDCKHMGGTLRQIVRKHGRPDFAFRSHSSANSRLSYEIVDAPEEPVDDISAYIEQFAQTMGACGARYAVPFASNHCHLHKDTYRFNQVVQTPLMVESYFRKHGIRIPELKVMVSGDSWSSEKGFEIRDADWFTNRSERLAEYRQANESKLDEFYAEEARTRVSATAVQKYFAGLARRLPWFLKWRLRHLHYTYVLSGGGTLKHIFQINVSTGDVQELPLDTDLNFSDHPLQIHTSAFVFVRSVGFRIFSHMSISKRVTYKVLKARKKDMELLNFVFNLDEYDMLPLWRLFRPRSIQTWLLRWRELLLYASLVRDRIAHGRIDFSKYLTPAPQ